MAKKEPVELKRVLRDEIGLGRDRWDMTVVQPLMAMARLRLITD